MKKFLFTLLVLFLPAFCFASQSGVRAYRNGNQAISSGSYAQVQLNAENFDLLGEFDTGTYTFTATQSGYYSVFASILWGNSGNLSQIDINKNSATIVQGILTTSEANYLSQSVSTIIYLGIGDTLKLYAWQNTGGNINLIGYSIDTFLAIWKIDETGGGGGAVAWGDITGTLSNQADLQEALDNLNMGQYYELIQNATTSAEFYLQKTISYGDILVVFFLTFFTIVLTCSIVWNFFWKK